MKVLGLLVLAIVFTAALSTVSNYINKSVNEIHLCTCIDFGMLYLQCQ